MEFVEISPESIEYIYKLYNTNEKKVAADVEILKEWSKQQPHFPPIAERVPKIYELSLLQTKFNVEKAKARLEAHVTLRTTNRDFYQLIARNDLPGPAKLPIVMTMMPNQGPNFERVVVVWTKDPHNFTTDNYIESILTLMELAFKCDYSYGYQIVVDCKNVTFDLIKRSDVFKIRRLLHLLINGYTSRLIAMHLINTQPFIQIGLAAVRVVLKEKLMKRIIGHENLETLYESLPPKYLPKEFGGTAGTLAEIEERYEAIVESNRPYLQKSDRYGTDESLRIAKVAENTGFGIEGTFKKLELD